MESFAIINKEISNSKDIILTIAIPTYKRFHLLKETLRSVFNLKFNISVEIIIVDNDPEQKDLAINEMAEFSNKEFKYYKNIENYGAAGNWNRCLELGKGKFITILHDDDFLCDNFSTEIEGYLASYQNNDSIPMIGFNASTLDQRARNKKVKLNLLYLLGKKTFDIYKRLRVSNEIVSKDLKDFIFSGCYVSTLGVVMDREKALLISGFDNTWYPIIDCEFYVRWIRNYGNVMYKDVKVSKYRMLDNDSMRPEVINAVIEKSYDLRMKIHNENSHLTGISEFAEIMKKIEQYTWNMKWRKGNEYKVTVFDIIKLFSLKVRCILHVRNDNK